ncbi:MAG: baseplate J/gp47 family protein [Oscillospiraceae bacterium]|nr:baseplate J/gp47 family protein [Oscillospiraceae bacterium]
MGKKMYEGMTFDFILGRMLDRIPDDVDKREGSVVYDALAPAALELAQFYSALDNVIDETFADTAGREMLIRRAAERGIRPYSATFAIVRGQFNMEVPVGTRFSIDDLRYRVTARIDGNDYDYRLTCEIIGAVGNRTSGDLIPVDYVEGLTLSKITGIVIPGEDVEDTEHLRRRYFDSIDTRGYGGNIADYRRATLAIQGVGGVKVFPLVAGPGSVQIVIQDYRWGRPTFELVQSVKDIIDPAGNPSRGFGMAPIGHSVFVEMVGEQVINLSADFKLAHGYAFEDIRGELDTIWGDYLTELASKWDSSDFISVHMAQIEMRFLNGTSGKLQDILSLRLNGSSNRTLNLSAYQIPVKGEITNVN